MATRRRRVISGDNEWNPLPLGSSEFYNPEPTPIPQRDGGSPRATPTPRPTPTPTATPANDFYENQRGVERNDPSITIFPSGPDFAGTEGDNVYAGNFDGDRYGSFPATDTPRLEPSFLFGGPSIETPTSTDMAGNLDNEPSLFPSTTNPFDLWWRTTTDAPTVTINNGDGGSIWQGEDTLGAFVGDSSLGTDLSSDLGSMNFGDRPAIDAPSPEEMAFNQPPPPGPIEEEFSNEWTTSPGDRRFLPSSGEPSVLVPRSGRGGDISSFGTFGNPLTLGGFFGHSLEAMRFGTDRYQPQITVGAEAQGGYNSSLGTYDSFDAEGNLIRTPGPPPADSPWDTGGRENAINPPGSGDFNAWPRGELLSPQPPAGMKIIGHDTRNGQPIYQDANGNKFVNPGTGTRVNPAFSNPDQYYADTYFNPGTGHYDHLRDTTSGTPFTADTGTVFFGHSDSPNQGAEQMGRIRQTTTDAGHNQFGWEPGAMMFIDDGGGFGRRSVSRPRGTSALRGWAGLVTSAAGRQSAASPLAGGR